MKVFSFLIHCILKQGGSNPPHASIEDPTAAVATASFGMATDQTSPEPQHQARAVSVPTTADAQAQEVPPASLTTSVASHVATIAIPNAESKPPGVNTAED